MTELASGLLDELDEQVPPVDFHERVSFPLPVLVICELLGVPYEDREEFCAHCDQMANMTDLAKSTAGMQGLLAAAHRGNSLDGSASSASGSESRYSTVPSLRVIDPAQLFTVHRPISRQGMNSVIQEVRG